MLPDVTPRQILAAQKVKRFLTGHLDLDLSESTYLPFPGTEKEYLRTLIARISASTLAAPKGLVKLTGGEEEQEASKQQNKAAVLRPPKRLLPMEFVGDFQTEPSKLSDRSACGVHVEPFITQLQVRCTLWKEAKAGEEESPPEDDEVAAAAAAAPKSPEEVAGGMPWAVVHVRCRRIRILGRLLGQR